MMHWMPTAKPAGWSEQEWRAFRELFERVLRLERHSGAAYSTEPLQPTINISNAKFNTIFVYHSDGADAQQFPLTEVGLQEATSVARVDDVIWIPSCAITLSAPIAIPDQVSVVGISPDKTSILGSLVLGESCTLSSLSIITTGAAAVYVYGVSCILSDMRIEAQGSGDALLVSQEGSTYVYNCNLEALGGWAIQVLAGLVYQFGGSARGATAPYTS